MPTTAQVAAAHYRAQQRITRRATNRVQALWRRMSTDDISGSWQMLAPQLAAAVIEGQQAAAGLADAYVAAMVAAQGAEPAPSDGAVNAVAFAGVASDGRPLGSLLYQPVIDWKTRIAAGASPLDARRSALASVLRITGTQVTDAGRTAVGASIAGRRTIQGYIRIAAAPCCARCAILSGKEYGWNQGFQRHPRCDCYHMPAVLVARGRGPAGRRLQPPPGGVTDARTYFEGLSHAEQDRIFTRAGAAAIRDGADINAVVNARRGMYTAAAFGRNLRATREGTTRRGAFFRDEFARLQAQGVIPRGISSRGFRLETARLMPEEIYRQAASRDEAIAMLRRYGYLT